MHSLCCTVRTFSCSVLALFRSTVRRDLHDNRQSADRESLGEWHKKQRKILNPAFSLAALRQTVPIMYGVSYKVRRYPNRSCLAVISSEHCTDVTYSCGTLCYRE